MVLKGKFMQNTLLSVNSIKKVYLTYASTEPFLGELEDGKEVIVKYLNNNEGNLVLINEFLSYCIASSLEVNIPDFGICYLPDSVRIDCDFFIQNENIGPAFYCCYIKNAVPLISNAFQISNIDNFVNTLILDHIIYNKDRHSGNYIYAPKGLLYAIDHSHVFKNQCIWDQYTFIQGMKNSDYKDTDILDFNKNTYDILFEKAKLQKSSFNKIISLVKTNLTSTYIHSIFNNLPKEWLVNIPVADLEKLEEYINYRISHIDDIVNLICEERGLL